MSTADLYILPFHDWKSRAVGWQILRRRPDYLVSGFGNWPSPEGSRRNGQILAESSIDSMIRPHSPHGGRRKRGNRPGHEQAKCEELIELVGAARRKSKSCGKFCMNQTEVSASDKEAALLYYRCLHTLWWVRWRQPRIPLVEGIHALYESKLIFCNDEPAMIDFCIFLESEIEGLPTCSETTPQTEQSSLNVSAQ